MNQVTIKWVKKAKQWVKTTKLPGDVKHHQRFKQEWSKDKPDVNTT
jgi:hypothetical protein